MEKIFLTLFYLLMCGLDIGFAMRDYRTKHYFRSGFMIVVGVWVFIAAVHTFYVV